MRAHYFQHVPFEGLGSIGYWLQQQNAQVSVTRFYAGDALPNPAKPDLLIVMGGPMSINDEADYPWLSLEKQFIRDFIAAGKPVVGICLGAQLIANAVGASVHQGAQKEIGWWSIQGAADVPAGCLHFPDEMQAFHWHGETFDLPDGAVRLASSAVCDNQVFQLGERVIGLQCHLETTLDSAYDIIEHCSDELVDAPYIQSAEQMLAANAEDFRAINDQMAKVMAYVTA